MAPEVSLLFRGFMRSLKMPFNLACYTTVGLLVLLAFFSADIWLAAAFHGAGFILLFFVKITSDNAKNDWQAESYGAALIAVMALVSWGPLLLGGDPKPVPALGDLYVTSGLLKKGAGGNRYIIKDDGKSLKIICADKHGKGPDNWCLYPHEKPYLGKAVTVYHSKPFKISNSVAHFYEMRSGDVIIVEHSQIASHIRDQIPHSKKMNLNFSIFLTIWSIYSGFVTFFYRRKAICNPIGFTARRVDGSFVND